MAAEQDALERAVRLLGPLGGRIMRAAWYGELPERFVVRDVQRLLPTSPTRL